jgi:glucose-6-phosphate-specific signal transduction histidine kinase
LKTETEQLNILILVFGLLLGAYARFLPTLMVGFPVTDGGLFYEMTKALQASHYSYLLPTSWVRSLTISFQDTVGKLGAG